MKFLDDNEDYDELTQKDQLTIVQFGSDSCGPCHAITNKIDKWLETHPSVSSRYIPIEKFQSLAAQHEVFSVPTTIIYYNSKELVRRSGYYSLEEVLSEGEKMLDFIAN